MGIISKHNTKSKIKKIELLLKMVRLLESGADTLKEKLTSPTVNADEVNKYWGAVLRQAAQCESGLKFELGMKDIKFCKDAPTNCAMYDMLLWCTEILTNCARVLIELNKEKNKAVSELKQKEENKSKIECVLSKINPKQLLKSTDVDFTDVKASDLTGAQSILQNEITKVENLYNIVNDCRDFSDDTFKKRVETLVDDICKSLDGVITDVDKVDLNKEPFETLKSGFETTKEKINGETDYRPAIIALCAKALRVLTKCNDYCDQIIKAQWFRKKREELDKTKSSPKKARITKEAQKRLKKYKKEHTSRHLRNDNFTADVIEDIIDDWNEDLNAKYHLQEPS